MIRLFVVIQGLAMRINSNGTMHITRPQAGDPFKIAKKEQWTNVTGNATMNNLRLALLDCIILYYANEPTWDNCPAAAIEAIGGEDVHQAAKEDAAMLRSLSLA